MNLKKFSVLAAAIALLNSSTVFADGINVVYNSTPVTFTSAQPAIVDDRALVPLRGVFDTMGYTVSYDAATKTATISDNRTVIKASSEKMSVTKDGKTTVLSSDVKPQLINDYFMAPLRAIAEATGAEVNWDSASRTVYINQKDIIEELLNSEDTVSEDDDNNDVNAGTMKTSEKNYLSMIQDTTEDVKNFAYDKNDALLKNVFGITERTSVGVSGGIEYYQSVIDNLEDLKRADPPESMKEIQALVEDYADEIISIINKGTKDNLSNEKLGELSLETSEKLTLISQDFSAKLWNYFIENDVYFEAIYGMEILDALK